VNEANRILSGVIISTSANVCTVHERTVEYIKNFRPVLYYHRTSTVF